MLTCSLILELANFSLYKYCRVLFFSFWICFMRQNSKLCVFLLGFFIIINYASFLLTFLSLFCLSLMQSETLSFDLHVLTYATFVSQLLYYYYLYNLYYDHVLCNGTQLLVFKKYNLGINLIGLSSFILLHLSYTLLLSIWKSLSYLDLKNFPLTMFLHFPPLGTY